MTRSWEIRVVRTLALLTTVAVLGFFAATNRAHADEVTFDGIVTLRHAAVASETLAAQCSQEDAQKAESEADTLSTWAEVFRSYQRYRGCDDGAISEGYSNSVATLLASGWKQVGSLLEIIKRHRDFETFVLRHVDDLMTFDQGKHIESNVRHRCPKQGAQFCAAVTRRFAELDKLDRMPSAP